MLNLEFYCMSLQVKPVSAIVKLWSCLISLNVVFLCTYFPCDTITLIRSYTVLLLLMEGKEKKYTTMLARWWFQYLLVLTLTQNLERTHNVDHFNSITKTRKENVKGIVAWNTLLRTRQCYPTVTTLLQFTSHSSPTNSNLYFRHCSETSIIKTFSLSSLQSRSKINHSRANRMIQLDLRMI